MGALRGYELIRARAGHPPIRVMASHDIRRRASWVVNFLEIAHKGRTLARQRKQSHV